MGLTATRGFMAPPPTRREEAFALLREAAGRLLLRAGAVLGLFEATARVAAPTFPRRLAGQATERVETRTAGPSSAGLSIPMDFLFCRERNRITGAGWLPAPLRHRFRTKEGAGPPSCLITGVGVSKGLHTDCGSAEGAGNPPPMRKDLALPAARCVPAALAASFRGASERGSTGQSITPATVAATVAAEIAEAREAIIPHLRFGRDFCVWPAIGACACARACET